MKTDLLYIMEQKYNDRLHDCLNSAKYDDLTIREFLDLGFNNSYLYIDNKCYELGYKYYEFDFVNQEYTTDFDYSSDFSLNEEQLGCVVYLWDEDYDSDGYYIVRMKLKNEEDKKYFINEESELI